MFGFPFLGLTIKSLINGELILSCKDCEQKERFAEKTITCGKTCAKISGSKFGSIPLLMCGPNDEPPGCKSKDGNYICLCDEADLCNKDLPSSAGRFVSYWSVITLAVFSSLFTSV